MSRPSPVPATWHLPFDHVKLQFRGATQWRDAMSGTVYASVALAERAGRACDQDGVWSPGEVRMMPCDKWGNHATGAKTLPAPPHHAVAS